MRLIRTSLLFCVSASRVTVSASLDNHLPIDVSKLTSMPSIFHLTDNIQIGLGS